MSWIQTYSKHRFDPLAVNPGKVVIEDIAHALSNLCRYTGHCQHFYSVAQHSVLVSKILKDKGLSFDIQLQGLLHDSTEAYMNDIARPVKMTETMKGYRQAEHELEIYLASHWGYKTFTTPEVKIADNECLATEMRDLMDDPKDWEIPYAAMPWTITPLLPAQAKIEFLTRYTDLMADMTVHRLQNR